MASDQQNREKLKQLYPSKTWHAKVDKMRPDQVTAILLKKQTKK